MLERELKLYIPAAQQAAVISAIQQLPAKQQLHLAARYFDTSERSLAHQGAALRLRLENEQWVQTLKMRGGDALSHVEYNHLRSEPTLDLNLYKDTPAAALFTQLSAPLEMRYQTDVQRTTALITTPQAEIELALDFGVIKAKELSLPISEIEFELKKGSMAEVFSTALSWLKPFNLLLELRSKAERGDALYEGLLSTPYSLNLQGTQNNVADAYTAGSSAFLHQVIRNAAFVAGIDGTDAAEKTQARYLMLMRVGIRRLRSCRQLFKPWLTTEEQVLAKRLRSYYKAFGTWRDSDMLWLELQPKLEQAGLPTAQALASAKSLRKKTSATPQELAASVNFQSLLVQSLACLVLNKAIFIPEDKVAVASQQIQQRLEKWFTRIQKQSVKFEQLNPSAQHDLRNRIKRLRYNLEVLGYSSKQPLYKTLAKAQDQLGDLCDAYVARSWYKKHAADKKQKQFALQWLEEKITKKHAKSKKALLLLQDQCLPKLFSVTQ